MKKLQMKFLITLVLTASALFVIGTRESLSDDKYIQGKVVYSDDLSPVQNAAVDVLLYSEPNKTGVEIENTTVNFMGEFKILLPPQSTDRIKIMAYPNEENTQHLFEKKVIDYDDAVMNRTGKYDLIIKVKRVTNSGKNNLD